MRINYNALAMNATTNFGKINNKVAKSMSRLSSGYKIQARQMMRQDLRFQRR